MNNQAGRIEFIDLTKGVCIILVVISHIGGAFSSFDTNPMVSCFRMPLYFFISGIFYKSYQGFGSFFLKKINKLFIPFLFFYITAFALQYSIYLLFPSYFRLPVCLSELLVIFQGHDLIRFNPPIWFLLALFNCCLLFYLVHYLRVKYLLAMFIVTALIGFTGFTLGKLQITLPLYIDVAMTALPFYTAGFWIRRYNFFLYPHRFDKFIPLFIIFALAVMYFTATRIGMRTNNYTGNMFQFYVAGFAGVLMILLLCKMINNLPVVSYLGRYSIITLGIHSPLLFLEFRYVAKYIHNPWLLASTLLFVTLLICRFTTPFFLRVIPQVVAQKDFIQFKES